MIETSKLTVSIGTHEILRGIDLALPPGQITGLVGESGSGKSMAALAIMGLLPDGMHAEGRVDLDGRNLLDLSEQALCRIRGKRIGMIFQEPMTALNPLMNIGDQVAEVLRIHQRLNRKTALTRARDRLDRVSLTAPRFPLTLYPHELSGGQRQRVAIALAIAERPDLLIADEPTTALDVTTQAKILDLLKELVRDEGMALLLITHDLAVVAGIADRVAVMQRGIIVEEGTTQEVFTRQSHPYTRALFAASTHQPRLVLPSARPRPLLQVQGAVRDYPLPRRSLTAPRGTLRAVDNVSFDIEAGESVGLVGESGCGKSTLTRAILGLDRLQGGRVLLDGQEIHAGRAMAPELRAKMQVVFQDPFGSFDPHWRVERLGAGPLSPDRLAPRLAGTSGRGAFRCRHHRRCPAPAYPRIFGRAASAHRHRTRADHQTPSDRAGRGGQRAGRAGAGTGVGPAGGAAGQPRPVLSVHQPRPVGRAPDHRPGDDHGKGSRRRDRPHPCRDGRAAASLYAKPDGSDAAHPRGMAGSRRYQQGCTRHPGTIGAAGSFQRRSENGTRRSSQAPCPPAGGTTRQPAHC